MNTQYGAGGRTRLKVGVELRQTAPGSLLWVRYKILPDSVGCEIIWSSSPDRYEKILIRQKANQDFWYECS